MFPRLPVQATFVADTKFVSGTQKMFLILSRNILCPQQMFPSLGSPRNIMSNICVRKRVSSFAGALRSSKLEPSQRGCYVVEYPKMTIDCIPFKLQDIFESPTKRNIFCLKAGKRYKCIEGWSHRRQMGTKAYLTVIPVLLQSLHYWWLQYSLFSYLTRH